MLAFAPNLFRGAFKMKFFGAYDNSLNGQLAPMNIAP